MALVKITRSRQMTIPKELFDELELHQGDYVEITRRGDQLIVRPKVVMDRDKEQAKERLFKLLDRIHARNKNVAPKEVEREIAQAIQEVRKNRRKRTSS